jgi:hypothetical protein
MVGRAASALHPLRAALAMTAKADGTVLAALSAADVLRLRVRRQT